MVLAEEFRSVLREIGVPDSKIAVSSTMVESDRYFPSEKKFQRPFKILICVNMIREKGIFELLAAIPQVLFRFPDSKFIFAGDGDQLNELKQQAREMNLEQDIDFLGYIDGNEKISVFKDAHVFALPSYTEGFPTVVLEAMAAGAALLYTPVGGLANTMVDGSNGYEISSMPPDPEEIAEKLVMLFERPKLCATMSKNNLLESREKFDAKVLSGTIEKIYRQIINI
jgi:glycosyltransferase involved in cell wall biosynthesis